MKKSKLGGAREGAGRPKGEEKKALGIRVPVRFHKEITALVRKEVERLKNITHL